MFAFTLPPTDTTIGVQVQEELRKMVPETLVAEDGTAWVNGAKIVFTNVLLFNGVAHIIDGVLNPGDAPFDRAALEPTADPTDRLAFPDASPGSKCARA
ncbi:hypothetical protein CEP54_014405 [Fusarium duplospermum]|uniref:FAS1 domain-containing protein n=1 Tax=Fusarium duplospermum TaxID=1325734 RepID=A0A428NWA8_9HYPO|nr:hypothetical protein CEP54_014405 [Fusarium duplospermum]